MVTIEDPQSLSDGSLSERSWIPYRSVTAMSTSPNQTGMSTASKDWLSFLFMTLGKSDFLQCLISTY
jgi:hypothetical protein